MRNLVPAKRGSIALSGMSWVFAAALLLVLSSLPALASESAKKVVFIPQWTPQAQFAGYYVAHEKGIYRRHGLDVDILPGGPDDPPSKLLKERTADFGTMFLASALQYRDNGPGYPESILAGEIPSKCIGFNLLNGIVKKSLQGTIEFKNDKGALARITFLENN